MGMANPNTKRQGLVKVFRFEAFKQLPPGKSMWWERKRLRDRNSIGDNLLEIVEAPKPKENGRVTTQELRHLINVQTSIVQRELSAAYLLLALATVALMADTQALFLWHARLHVPKARARESQKRCRKMWQPAYCSMKLFRPCTLSLLCWRSQGR
jgi:hypothetical protein